MNYKCNPAAPKGKVIFESARKIPFKTRAKNNLLRLFLTSEVICSLVRLFLKNSLKRFFGHPYALHRAFVKVGFSNSGRVWSPDTPSNAIVGNGPDMVSESTVSYTKHIHTKNISELFLLSGYSYNYINNSQER